jgi:hypothetical protein
VNASGPLEHEFGHLIAGLHDEYVLHDASYPTPPVDGPNCVTDLSKAWWTGVITPIGVPAPVNPQGCRFYAVDIWRPYDTCRMRQPAMAFCQVCQAQMISGATDTPLPEKEHGPGGRRNSDLGAPRIVRAAYMQAPQPPPPVRSSVRALISLTLDPAGNPTIAHTVATADVDAPAAKLYRRTGDYVFEIKDGGVTSETGFLSGDPFEQRAFGLQSVPHATQASSKADVVIFVPNMRKSALATRSVQINFYRLKGVDPRFEVSPDSFARLKPSERVLIASVPVGDLQEAARKP